jgi:hypothetical protein
MSRCKKLFSFFKQKKRWGQVDVNLNEADYLFK